VITPRTGVIEKRRTSQPQTLHLASPKKAGRLAHGREARHLLTTSRQIQRITDRPCAGNGCASTRTAGTSPSTGCSRAPTLARGALDRKARPSGGRPTSGRTEIAPTASPGRRTRTLMLEATTLTGDRSSDIYPRNSVRRCLGTGRIARQACCLHTVHLYNRHYQDRSTS
jgi:hypothetical protein